MDASATLTRTTPLVQLSRAALVTATAGYLALSVSLAARRGAGGLQPLDAASLSALALCVPAAILLVRMLWPSAQPRRAVDWFVRIAPSASAVLLAAAVSLPNSSPHGLAALWLAVVAVEAALISRELRPPPFALLPSPFSPRPSPLALQTTQSLVRQTVAAGSETISGELRAAFRPGERIVFLHVAFCPPLASVPTIECEQIAGPEAEIKIAQSQAYGARFDVRLKRETTGAADVQLRFVARS